MKQRGERLENRTRDILEPFDDPLPVDLSLTIVVGFHVIECMCRHTEIQGYLIISYGEGIGQLRRIRFTTTHLVIVSKNSARKKRSTLHTHYFP